MKSNFYEEFIKTIPEELAIALDTQAQTSIRYNRLKTDLEPELSRVPWCPTEGYYIDERPIFTVDPAFHAGAYYVQEASSMFVGWLVRRAVEQGLVEERPRIVDLCAAPGGKTTQLAGVASVVVANEVIRARAKILSENVQRWGSGNVAVTSNDPRQFGESALSCFDVMVVDTPCSGEGMFRKDRGAREEWSPENVALCSARSRRIVSDAWGALRDGGLLIYSTCTFNRAENEDNARWICDELGGEVVEFGDVPEGVYVSEAGYRFFPHRVRGEGFYVVAIRKGGDELRREVEVKKNSKTMTQLTPTEQREALRWIGKPLNFAIGGGSVYGFDDEMCRFVEFLRGAFNLLYSGVLMGEFIRGEIKPSHSLALYFDVAFERRTELSLEDALEYLRRGNVSAERFLFDGLNLATYKGLPIGWAMKIGNRVNNLYPQHLRIVNY